MPSKIEWTDETWNPVIGCSKISAGCQNCYAERMACRLAHMGNWAYQDVVQVSDQGIPIPGNQQGWNGKTAFVESALDKPLRWKKPRRIFVCSMGDLFHESVPMVWIDEIFHNMDLCNEHAFMVLTKRAERMKEFIRDFRYKQTNKNIWLGVTAENQKTADERIPVLLQIPAAVRFVSVEPMLGPVDLNFLHYEDAACEVDALNGTHGVIRPHRGKSEKLDWIICGGESGPGARPMNPEWVRSLRGQCVDAEIPFFFKQWGEYGLNWLTDNDGNKIPGSEWMG